MPVVFVVEDDADLNWTLCRVLKSHGYMTVGFGSGEDALLRLRDAQPELLLLDLNLPGVDGYRLARQVRASGARGRVPIVFMTIDGELESRLRGFAAGADDFLVKPFDLRELLARVQAILRRTQNAPSRPEISDATERTLQVGALLLEMDTATARTGDSSAQLTPTELQLLRIFMQNAGRILSNRFLLNALWGVAGDTTDNTAALRWHIKNLRQKLEVEPARPVFLLTVGHHGYRLVGGRG